jgi:hypothetical protein
MDLVCVVGYFETGASAPAEESCRALFGVGRDGVGPLPLVAGPYTVEEMERRRSSIQRLQELPKFVNAIFIQPAQLPRGQRADFDCALRQAIGFLGVETDRGWRWTPETRCLWAVHERCWAFRFLREETTLGGHLVLVDIHTGSCFERSVFDRLGAQQEIVRASDVEVINPQTEWQADVRRRSDGAVLNALVADDRVCDAP